MTPVMPLAAAARSSASVASTTAIARRTDSGAFSRGSCNCAAFTAGRELAAPERFSARSADESEVGCWIVKPADYEPGKKYPTLLSIHGGPFTQYSSGFFDEFQVYAGAGYVVLFSNPRGGSGYSEDWGRAIRGPVEGGPGWGTVDFEDLMGVVDTASLAVLAKMIQVPVIGNAPSPKVYIISATVKAV